MRELYPNWRTELTPVPDDELRTVDALWRETTDYAAKLGLNAVIIDIGEGVVFPSHPESAIRGSWSPDKLRDELGRLRKLGLEPIPKLNFSTRHNGWMGEFRRMVSSTPYYRFCEDVIRDVRRCSKPRATSMRHDERTGACVQSAVPYACSARRALVAYFLHVVARRKSAGCVRGRGTTKGGIIRRNLKRSRERLQCSCTMTRRRGVRSRDQQDGGPQAAQAFWISRRRASTRRRRTNWRREAAEAGVGAVHHGQAREARRMVIAPSAKGFGMASWMSCDTREHVEFVKQGIDLLAEAV